MHATMNRLSDHYPSGHYVVKGGEEAVIIVSLGLSSYTVIRASDIQCI